MTTVADFASVLGSWFPLALAAEWDNVGLLVGDPAAAVEKVMTCLTVTPASAEEAIREGANLIVSHHPVLFRPAKSLTPATTEGAMLLNLIRAGVAVYSPHTAFDNAVGGINDILAARLNLQEVRTLRALATEKTAKLAIFVPDSDLAKVSDAVFAAGAGIIGQYRECSFRLAGTGTFFGGDATNPTVGKKGRREEAAEWRLEVVCPASKVEAVIRAMRKAHSYEEPALDIYPLTPDPSRNGAGRLGKLPTSISLGELVAVVNSKLNATSTQVVGDPSKKIQTVALACGAAGEFLSDAIRARADVFLTGELRFHEALAAESQGIAVVVAGHYPTERPAVEELADRLAAHFAGVRIWPSREERDPLTTSAARLL